MPLNWQNSLGFSQRFEAVTRLYVNRAFKVLDRQADQSSQAACKTRNGRERFSSHQEAVQLENEVFRTASSLSGYENTINAHVARAESIAMRGDALIAAEGELDVDRLIAGGLTIGKYTNAHHHRDGGSSTVYRARAPDCMSTADLDGCPTRIVALKVIDLATIRPPHNAEREARLLTKAQSPNVIALLDSFRDANRLVLVLPFMAYDTGQQLHKTGISPSRKKRCVRDVIKGLAYIHSQGIIHRDIKPSNILLKTPSGPSYIADFGIAWSDNDPTAERVDEKILDVGTTCYRPPELLFGNQKYDSSLDLWAMGCVAAQMISLGSETLFESGDLGSDLALIKSMFETLGTPNEGTWPEVVAFPDWGKMTFHQYPSKSWEDILPNTDDESRHFVSSLVRFESKDRLTAEMALKHPYLAAMKDL